MIIGIYGNINVGKDTFVDIFNYIDSVGRAKANFRDWRLGTYALTEDCTNNVIHFADTVKNSISNILNIDRELLDDRQYKDILWYSPSTGEFMPSSKIINKYKLTLENYAYFNNIFAENTVIKLRQIIQMYAEGVKSIFGKDVWVNSTKEKILKINNEKTNCFVPDIRFDNEAKVIKDTNGIIVKLTRPNNDIVSQHNSENNNFDYDYLIENNGSLQNLFYKIMNLYQQLNLNNYATN